MIKKFINLILFITTSILFWYLSTISPNQNIIKLFHTSLALVLIYSAFKIIIEGFFVARLSDNKTKYSIRKAISLAQLALFIIIFITIWIENVQALFVAYGLIAAGVAVSLQDFFKNIMGGLVILTSSTYRVGDRIEIEDKTGDVIDIGIMYTTLLELKQWVSGDQATGRLIIIPNGRVLSQAVHNYTKDNLIMWDEIMIPLTHQSNWEKAEKDINKILEKQTKEVREKAEKEITHLSSKYYLTKRDASSSIYIKITDNWIELNIRYVTEVRLRRQTNADIQKLIFEYIKNEPDLSLATQSLIIKKP